MIILVNVWANSDQGDHYLEGENDNNVLKLDAQWFCLPWSPLHNFVQVFHEEGTETAEINGLHALIWIFSSLEDSGS